jgi:intracellular septation protein A
MNQEERDDLVRSKKHLEDESYKVSKKLFKQEYNLALMRGVCVISLVLIIIFGTLTLFNPWCLKIVITATLIGLIFFVMSVFYKKHLMSGRVLREELRRKYSDVCRRLDAADAEN